MSDESPLQQLQEVCLEAHSVIRDEIVLLFQRYGQNTPAVVPTLDELFRYLSSRSQAVSFLLSWGYAWDAEIILRSFYETAAKILFICFSEENDKLTLIDEFWNKLRSISDRRRARKAEYNFRNDGTVSSEIFKAFTDERVFDLDAKGNKAERKRLEQKWSFAEIVNALEGRMVGGKPLQGMLNLLHMYGICSHLAHSDSVALDMMADRKMRPPEELQLLKSGHAARIMSDQVSLTWFCADALRHHFKGEFSNEGKMIHAFQKPLDFAAPIQSAFEESQRAFYEKLQQR